MDELVSIGRFSTASRLSPKALRLYDENGLLPPAHVDPDSGYRYYRREQLRQAAVIRWLRRAGMPLADIRAFLADSKPSRLDEFERALVGELGERRLVLRYLRRLLEEETMFSIATKHVEPQPYVGRTTRVRVEGLEPFIMTTIRELSDAHRPAGPAFSLYHGPVTEDDDGPVEVGVPTAEGELDLPAAEVAYTVARGERCAFPAILGAYDAIAEWAQRESRELAGPPREIYLAGPGTGEDEVVEIAWPIR